MRASKHKKNLKPGVKSTISKTLRPKELAKGIAIANAAHVTLKELMSYLVPGALASLEAWQVAIIENVIKITAGAFIASVSSLKTEPESDKIESQKTKEYAIAAGVMQATQTASTLIDNPFLAAFTSGPSLILGTACGKILANIKALKGFSCPRPVVPRPKELAKWITMNNFIALLPGPIINYYAPTFFPGLGQVPLALLFNLVPLVLGVAKSAFTSAGPSADTPEVDHKKMVQYAVTAGVAQSLATAGIFAGNQLLEVASKGAHLAVASGVGLAAGAFFNTASSAELVEADEEEALLNTEGGYDSDSSCQA